jgi:asparagine synthase (glutamine-hydrolysing)
MCGIAGIHSIDRQTIQNLDRKLRVMGQLIKHRGPDGEGKWKHSNEHVGFAHQRLTIIDLA